MSHALTENRTGLVVQVQVSLASRYAERDTAVQLLDATQTAGRNAREDRKANMPRGM
jgi:hypothetical protein